MTDQGAVPDFDGAEPPTDGPTDRDAATRETDPHTSDDSETDDSAEPAKTTSARSGAEAVVASLETAGVDTVFGVQGGAIMPVYDALYDAEEISHVTMAHEQGAAHAADAYGAVTGDPGICMATSGPGATNLVTGIADADMDSEPVVALTGQAPSDLVGNDAFQETDTVGVTTPITKSNTFASSADEVGEDVSTAFALAASGRQGPTLVDLPKDVTTDETDIGPTEPSVPDTVSVPDRADEGAVEAAGATIADAERPVILAGGGVVKGNASDELRAFAKEHDIPVATTMPGIGAFPEDHDLALEMAGMHGTGYANMAVTTTDCLLGVGTRFDDRLTGGVDSFAPDATVVHVDIDRAEISKNVEADHPLVGDAGTVLDQLAAAMDSSPDTDEWVAQCADWTAEYPMDYAVPAAETDEGAPDASSFPDDQPVKPQFVVEAVDAATDDDTVVTTGVGQHQMWACQYWTYTEPRTWVSSHGLGAMGYGLPSAIGARVAADDDQSVVCFDGDGSFLMTCQELVVAARENLDITVFVLNNEAIGMVRQWQDAFFDGRRMASEYPWVPKFDTLAEAFGADGFRIESYEDAPDVIEAALETDGPAVVDVYIDPTEDVYPMVPSGGDNGQFALSEDHL
ncbi:biosynthetic-type acetolactate synthase large subunit [Halobacterium salinarum]|uniref:biosynthetic-type acetolactate synthase large subunit n=1 Tax=Halobacterium salinarum TaxID=2242 RepID=UPI002554871D|nr:biosynthetic-type acetolactate synthase large subunit [Halobacterium salinarum]MDL0130930.1 biosynthetic-type acetolactate synthase large subunit [Halobacterium salinarum]MDL0132097.1 biosynthetic-type acetolactate synthase large subunit [Halobacterium salinarum]